MIAYVLYAVVAAVAVGLGLFRPRNGAGLTWVGGLALLWLGQGAFAEADAELPGTALGLVVVGISFALRLRALGATTGPAQATERLALIWQGVGSASILVWALTTATVTDALGLTGEAYDRWTVSFTALWPILALAGGIPTLLLDQALGAHPVAMPEGARAQAAASGLALAFGIALVFPVNYLADQTDVSADFSYFRVTDPGEATYALVRTLPEPVEILLFYPPANEVKEELLPYFQDIVAASDGKLSVRVIDQPTEPVLAKELAVRDNGYVVFRKGDDHQKFKVDEEIKRARRDLKKLDGTVQKHLIKLVRDKRNIYVLTGHGEATHRAENPFFKLSELRTALQNLNFGVQDFGIEEGSADAVPSDAAVVIVAAPETQLFPEEVKALQAYVDGGGALLVYADPGRDRMTDLLGHLGLAVGEHTLVNASKFVPVSGGVVDRANLASNRFGSHASTATLSKYSTRASVVLFGAVDVTETGSAAAPGPVKYTPLIRSFEDTWPDADGDFERDPDEATGVSVLAIAAEGPPATDWRAIVVGDVTIASDIVVQRSQGSAQFALDSVRWLVGDEELAGETSNEEDVRIEHTHEGDQLWFYSTLFGVPALVLALGAFLVRRRTTG